MGDSRNLLQIAGVRTPLSVISQDEMVERSTRNCARARASRVELAHISAILAIQSREDEEEAYDDLKEEVLAR